MRKRRPVTRSPADLGKRYLARLVQPLPRGFIPLHAPVRNHRVHLVWAETWGAAVRQGPDLTTLCGIAPRPDWTFLSTAQIDTLRGVTCYACRYHAYRHALAATA